MLRTGIEPRLTASGQARNVELRREGLSPSTHSALLRAGSAQDEGFRIYFAIFGLWPRSSVKW